MICDSLNHAQQYASLHKGFDAAFRYLAALDAHNMPAAGTYEIDGDDVYASVQYYETMPEEYRYPVFMLRQGSAWLGGCRRIASVRTVPGAEGCCDGQSGERFSAELGSGAVRGLFSAGCA